MQKNKKTNTPLFWHQWTQSPDFLKNLLIALVIFIVFILIIIFMWQRSETKEQAQSHALQQISPSTATEKTPPLSNEAHSVSDRLAALEQKMLQQEQISQLPHKLVAVDLLQGALEGMIPLEVLKRFLQKTSELWANTLLTTLIDIKESKTYPQLETLFALSPSHSPSTWQRIKNKVNSFIHIRKVDGKSEDSRTHLKDIRKALRAHDIQKATELFENLSSEEKAQLSSWKEVARARLLLELSAQELLIELGNSKNP